MISDQPEPTPEPAGASISLRGDSVRLGTVGDRVKCIVVIDITPLTPDQQQLFASRAMVALGRMGEKIINRRKE